MIPSLEKLKLVEMLTFCSFSYLSLSEMIVRFKQETKHDAALCRVRRTWRATDLVFFLDLHSMYMFATIKSDTKRNSAKLV